MDCCELAANAFPAPSKFWRRKPLPFVPADTLLISVVNPTYPTVVVIIIILAVVFNVFLVLVLLHLRKSFSSERRRISSGSKIFASSSSRESSSTEKYKCFPALLVTIIVLLALVFFKTLPLKDLVFVLPPGS